MREKPKVHDCCGKDFRANDWLALCYTCRSMGCQRCMEIVGGHASHKIHQLVKDSQSVPGHTYEYDPGAYVRMLDDEEMKERERIQEEAKVSR